MDIKDAEFQEWYNDLPQEREWFNEPQIDHWSKEPLDNTKVLCEYWAYSVRNLKKMGGKYD